MSHLKRLVVGAVTGYFLAQWAGRGIMRAVQQGSSDPLTVESPVVVIRGDHEADDEFARRLAEKIDRVIQRRVAAMN